MARGPQSGPPGVSIRPTRYPRNVKNDRFVYQVFFQAIKHTKTHFLLELCPGPAEGAYDAPPDPLDGWGGGHPSPFSPPRRLRHLDLAPG